MKADKLAFVCGLAIACFSHHAFAYDPSVTPDLEVFISGSSSQQGALGSIVEGMMGYYSGDPYDPYRGITTDVYYDTASNGSNYRAYFGTVNGTRTVLDGMRVLVHVRALGGSFQGVGPLARAQSISNMAINSSSCVATSAAYPAATYKCANTVNAVPDAGVSDVEPELFVGANLPAGQTALSATELGHITSTSQNAVVFGIAVTDNVPLTSLSRSQITSLLTGAYQDWGMVSPSLAGNYVRVERRAPGSGAQALANAYFGGFPCSTGAYTLANATAINQGGYEVVENSSTGGVKSGLNADFAAGKYSIGLMSIENTPAPGTDHWHFVSIDGVAPTVANAIAGRYDFLSEQSIQQRNTAVNGIAAPSGLVATFLTEFNNRLGDPAVLTTLPGVAALPTNFTPVLDGSGNVTNGVMKGVRGGGNAGTCAPLLLYF